MKKRFPLYCPLDVAFDAERLRAELFALLPSFSPMPTKHTNLDPTRWFRLGEDFLYANVEHYILAQPDAAPVFVAGAVPGWRGIGLTHVPGVPATAGASNSHRRKHDGAWAWRADLEIPYTRELLASLPFTRLDTVRVLSLPAGGFGPAHADCRDDTPWEVDGIASISFLLRDGGVPMRFRASDGALRDVNDPVFFFKDCAPHGVPRTASRRLLLRINGAARSEPLFKLMRLEEAVW